METSLHLSQHVELHGMMETLTRSDAQWNVELGALCLMLALRRARTPRSRPLGRGAA